MPESLPFDTLNALLTRDEMAIDAAELHGSLCAQACVSEDLQPDHWLKQALGREVLLERLSADLQRALESLFIWTLNGLRDPQLGFSLYLPEDEAGIVARADALARWCAGFVSGYGAAGAQREVSSEAREFLNDLTEIAQADFDHPEGEDEEQAYVELSEYARVGAMLVFETLRGPDFDEATH